MNLPSEQEIKTIQFYDEEAEGYVRSTMDLDITALYEPFLALIPSKGKILDAGCGSGRDSKWFEDRGYLVTAIDASPGMAESASRFIGRQVSVVRLQEIDYQGQFDGIWACASLLHVPRPELDDVLKRLADALKPNGVCYISFKEGLGERSEGRRHFIDFTVTSLEQCLARHSEFEAVRLWATQDSRPGREQQRWLNCLLSKQTLDKLSVPGAEQAELFAIVESTKKDIVLPKETTET